MARKRPKCSLCGKRNAMPDSNLCSICAKGAVRVGDNGVMNAFDTAQPLDGLAPKLITSGIEYIGVYGRKDRTDFAEVQQLMNAGFKVWTLAERGEPIDETYFTPIQAQLDAIAVLGWAKMIGQPKVNAEGIRTGIYCCIDFDAPDPAVLLPYVRLMHQLVRAEGYLLDGYGSWKVLNYFKSNGWFHRTMLAQSRGWEDYEAGVTLCDILQEDTVTYEGLNVDPNVIRNPAAGFWFKAS